MATDIMAKASLATSDADLQTQLGLKAFLQAMPRNIGRELRRRHFNSVKEALTEERFLQSVEEEENCGSGKIFTVEREPLEEGLKVEIKQIVKDCIKEMQAQQLKKERSERPRSSRRKLWCWYCREVGHLMKGCPVVQQDRTAPCRQKAGKRMPDSAREFQNGPDGARERQRVPDGTRECQRVPEGTRWYEKVPEGARWYQRVPDDARGCQRVPGGTRVYQRVPEGARWCQRVPDGVRGCQRMPEGARWYQWVPEGPGWDSRGPRIG